MDPYNTKVIVFSLIFGPDPTLFMIQIVSVQVKHYCR